jgi:hypothetical protein
MAGRYMIAPEAGGEQLPIDNIKGGMSRNIGISPS